jgi:2-polyprenyl-3-methyl-5-hydroxy-6-metoxy-1,4-benzoquinol methylase
MKDEQLRANRAMWDERVAIHVRSEFYDNESFKVGRVSLHQVEIDEMGDVGGKRLLHLQCHFGQDTMSWARLGAKVTGIDFSPSAVEVANGMATELGLGARFVCANVYDAGEALGGECFDVVYTGGGAIIWLDDIERWARIVADSLEPGGVLYLREFHPVAGVFDYESLELKPRFRYFTNEALYDETPGTYTDGDAQTQHNASYEWVHTVGDVVTAVAGAGLVIEFLHEFSATGYRALPMMVRGNDGMWRLPGELHEMLPLMYSLRARKPGP